MNISIAYGGHGCEGPIKTEYVFRIDISMIDACNYKPTVWIGKFIIADHEKEAGDPVSDKGDQND